MSPPQGNRRLNYLAYRQRTAFRRLRRPSVKKSLKFDDAEEKEKGVVPTQDFWSNPPPPPPLFASDVEQNVGRRSMRLWKKSQFPFSQIAARSPEAVGATPTWDDDVLGMKPPDGVLTNVFSDYGTASNSSFYFHPSQSTTNSSIANCSTKTIPKKFPNISESGSQSMGYSSDLDEVMSNLSLEEGASRLLEFSRRSESDEEYLDGKDNDSHLGLADVKLDNLKATLVDFQGIHVLIPLKGYEILPTQKCIGRRFKLDDKYPPVPRKSLRYDLRNRPSNPQLENNVCIETFDDIRIEDNFRKAGLRVFQVSPIISIQPHAVKFCSLYPAIVQIPLNIDTSFGEEVHCLYSRSSVDNLTSNYSSIQWSSELAGKCSIKDGKVSFETFQFGLFVLVIRLKSSTYRKNIRSRVGGRLLASDFPNVEVVFPKEAVELKDIEVKAAIILDTELSVSEFITQRLSKCLEKDETKGDCLASPIIQLEPHGIKFEPQPVMITLPIPDYDLIKSKLGDQAKLSIWQSDTHPNEPSRWEKVDVEYQLNTAKANGDASVTFAVTHFSFFKAVWETISEYLYDAKIGMFGYFVSFPMKCQANMQEYSNQTGCTNAKPATVDEPDGNVNRPLEGGRRFGLEVIIFHADKIWPQMATYKYPVGQSCSKLVKAGRLSTKLKSLYFEPDIQAGEEEEMVKEEDFRGRDFEKQFICKFKPDVNIERGPFGKVLVTRHVSPRQKEQSVFEFNLQKRGNEGDPEDKNDKEGEEWSMVALTELANSLFVTEGDNWKQFAEEIGMTKQEIKPIKKEANPFQKIVAHYRQRGGTPQDLVNALYKCHRTLKVVGPYSGRGSNPSRSSKDSSGRGSLSSNNAHLSRFGSHDSDTSGTQTSQDSGIPPGRKRSHHSSFRASGSGGTASLHGSLLSSSKRKRLSHEPGTSSRMLNDEADVESSASTSGSEDNGSIFTPPRQLHRKLEVKFLWAASAHLSNPKWMFLGRSLGVEETVLLEIDASANRTANFRECAYKMLQEWKQRFPKKCTLGNLASALRKEGMQEIAKEILKIEFDDDSD